MAKPPKSLRQRAYVNVEGMELEDRVVRVDRTRKTVKGGRIPSSRATVVVGDGRGHVGIGVGKARQAPDAIRKAIEAARRSVIRVPLDGCTIPHEIVGRCGGAKVLLKPASRGTGIIAGTGVRPVMELAGIRDILSKSLGSKSTLNRTKATFYALCQLRDPHEVAKIRGKTVVQMVGREVIDDYAAAEERPVEQPEQLEAAFANGE
jgi:small subunit ribosomal protein S5